MREFLNRLAGRSGNAGDKAVLHSELAELGLANEIGQRLSLPASAVGSITDTLEPALPSVPVIETDRPDSPTNASGLAATGIFGAVILEWEAPAYNDHNHTEVWRAQEDDREQASLVHESNGSRYTDVTGNTTLHYYWVRHVNRGGQVGGFNALAGTPGQGTAIINLADLLLESPELSEKPFSVRNVGTDKAPEYVLIFNGYLAVNGPVNISQLKSGELQNGTALTVGRGSIELSTGTDGFGQMVITGSGGIANNDYLLLKEGRIESFIYSETSGHIRYKELRRTESGVATNGQEVVIPAYFKATYLDGKIHPPVEVWCERAGYRYVGIEGLRPSSLANIYIRSIRATVYYRRPRSISTSPLIPFTGTAPATTWVLPMSALPTPLSTGLLQENNHGTLYIAGYYPLWKTLRIRGIGASAGQCLPGQHGPDGDI